MDQLRLFDRTDQTPPDLCRFPDVRASSGYRYGCRCPRCKEGHRLVNDRSIDRICYRPDCSNIVVEKAARYCPSCTVERNRCKVDGCVNQRRPGQGARYCSEHLHPSSRPVRALKPGQTYQCCICDRLVRRGHSRSPRYPVCDGCRNNVRGLAGSAARHRVPLEMFIRWAKHPYCDLCGDRLSIGKNARRYAIDHDHDHCAGQVGCPDCVRGLLCTACNTQLGAVESILTRVGKPVIEAYLGRRLF